MKNDEKRGVSKRTVAILLALVLVIGCAVGGTLAWLTAKTDNVTNTFSPSDINITLTETPNYDSDNDGKTDCWKVKMVPGYSYEKNPVVTVQNGSEDCYLFVKFEENNNPSTYLDYTSLLTTENGWTQGTGESGDGVPTNVWYRVVKSTDATKSWHLLKDDTITVNGEKVTKATMNAADNAELVYTAYACQYYKSNDSTKSDDENAFTPSEAWTKASALDTTGTGTQTDSTP